jgi:uncharacterized MAPEG superfamily protein
MSDAKYLVWSAILTLLMLLVASLLKSQGWTPAGMMVAFGNREAMPPETPLAGRADRAAKNMIEAMVMFTALIAAVHFAGKTSPTTQMGAALFFWARLAYWPCYLAGVIYLRTAIWAVSLIGLIMIAAAVW